MVATVSHKTFQQVNTPFLIYNIFPRDPTCSGMDIDSMAPAVEVVTIKIGAGGVGDSNPSRYVFFFHHEYLNFRR